MCQLFCFNVCRCNCLLVYFVYMNVHVSACVCACEREEEKFEVLFDELEMKTSHYPAASIFMLHEAFLNPTRYYDHLPHLNDYVYPKH